MLSSLKTYVSDRKAGIAKTAGLLGGLYIAKLYITDRLDEVKARLEQERVAKDNLRRRFEQTQDDVSYTVLTLLPTLGDQILEKMDVEAITRELQFRSKARNGRQPSQMSSSLASSIDIVQQHEARSENGSVSVTSTGFSLAEAESNTPASVPNAAVRIDPQLSYDTSTPLSASVITASTHDSPKSKDNLSLHSSQQSENFTSASVVTESSDGRTKAELWNEVKMLTLTRTLTTLYSTTLLCLLTTIQLTFLARSKYVHSVLQQEQDERMRERLEAELTLTNLIFGGHHAFGDLMSQDLEAYLGEDRNDNDKIPEDTENKYITLSWWLLHVGWKDVGERVRRGVDEVFDGVSLKTKLSIKDLHQLISDVRRRVEHEITFEGNERRINFLSTLLPPTPEMVQHVLTQGGFPSYNDEPSSPSLDERHTQASSTSLSSSQLSHSNYFLSALNNTDPFASFGHTLSPAPIPSESHTIPMPNPHPHTTDVPFTNLLNETQAVIRSSDFATVLENCLDRAVQVLFDGLEKNVFVDSTTSSGEEVRIRLAGLLPGLSRWSTLALRSIPCELVDNVFAVRDVQCLSAIQFAKFEDKFR